jgi:hypothetical protein
MKTISSENVLMADFANEKSSEMARDFPIE